ncbi:hypothetical protein I311_06960 [Cryptococcus gattii NT-10]|nr:hypothetical protein I311_06960 [Cryptococcus gattii NT-10]
MPSSQQPPPPTPSILSLMPPLLPLLREGGILRRISQLEVGYPRNNLPASPAASLPSNPSSVAPQQLCKSIITCTLCPSSQQGKPRFQWTRGSNVVDGLHPEGHLAIWMGLRKLEDVLYSNSREEATVLEGVTEEDIAKGIDTWDKKLHSLLQQAIGNKEAEELGEPLFMTINCHMNEDISTADEGGDCVEDEASQGAQGQRQVRRKAFHKVQDNIIQMMLEVNANDQKGRMEFAAFQAEAEATARAEEREAESARYSAEAALRNVEAKRVEEEHQICMAKRKREEEAAEEERNIKRTTAIQARTMWLVEFAKKDAVEAEKQAYWEITGKEKRF